MKKLLLVAAMMMGMPTMHAGFISKTAKLAWYAGCAALGGYGAYDRSKPYHGKLNVFSKSWATVNQLHNPTPQEKAYKLFTIVRDDMSKPSKQENVVFQGEDSTYTGTITTPNSDREFVFGYTGLFLYGIGGFCNELFGEKGKKAKTKEC